MSFTLKTPKSQIEAFLDTQIGKAREVVVSIFMYVGEECVKEARENGSYTDQTGNLRSSIGYAVVVDGKIVKKKVVEQTLNGSAGASEATSFLERLAQNHKSGICLIVVAGMNYAEYVESKGRNVLTSAELLAERMVPQMLTQLGFTIK